METVDAPAVVLSAARLYALLKFVGDLFRLKLNGGRSSDDDITKIKQYVGELHKWHDVHDSEGRMMWYRAPSDVLEIKKTLDEILRLLREKDH